MEEKRKEKKRKEKEVGRGLGKNVIMPLKYYTF